jgi:TRAP-type C4-dicarboxylate transport system permease small subunit
MERDAAPAELASTPADLISEVLAWIGAGLLLLTACITVADILGRAVGAFTIVGLVDITQLLVVAGVSLMFPLTFLREANVSVDTFTEQIGRRRLQDILIASSLLGALLMGALTWFSALQALAQWEQGDRSQTIGVPVVFYWAPLVIGCAGASLCALLRALAYTRALPHLGD